jgi:hypothetical protein
VARRQRLVVHRVECGTGQPAVLQCLDERRLVRQRTAADVDEPRARLHRREDGRTDHSAGLLREWRREDDEVVAGHDLARSTDPWTRPNDSPSSSTARSDRPTASTRDAGHGRADRPADRARPHDERRGPGEPERGPVLPPLVGLTQHGPGQVLGHRQCQTEDVLGDRGVKDSTRIRHDDPAARDCRREHPVDASTGQVRSLQVRGGRQRVGEAGRRKVRDEKGIRTVGSLA